MFLAVSLLDSYLTKEKEEKRITCLGSLAVSCLLIAAKLEEPKTPSFQNMCQLLERLDLVKIKKDTLNEIESKIMLALDFSIRNVISLNFLDRYLRLYGMDQGKFGSAQVEVVCLSYKLCMVMIRDG